MLSESVQMRLVANLCHNEGAGELWFALLPKILRVVRM